MKVIDKVNNNLALCYGAFFSEALQSSALNFERWTR